MPRLFDLLGDETDKGKLRKMAAPPADRPARNKPAAARTSAPPQTKQADSLRMWSPDFVALDLETTGLDQSTDRITEVGAIVFTNGKPGAVFSKLVNPGKPIPPHITALTGITDAMVTGAPSFAEIYAELIAFIGPMPICGQQVDFDFGFLGEELKRTGKPKLQNYLLDTAALARLAIPDLPGYSLGEIARYFDIPLVTAHRALEDATATGHIAVATIQLLGKINPDIRRSLAWFSPPSIMKRILETGLESRTPQLTSHARQPQGHAEPLRIPEEITPIDDTSVEELFGAKDGLPARLSGFEPRPGQTAMAIAVGNALNRRELLAAEAGTGVGKSLAYLVPASLFALRNNCRVIISTHTRNLQDQLAGKDLPLMRSLCGNKLAFSVLKGRANYLCLHRYRQLYWGEIGNLSPRDRAGLLPLIRWAEETACGDIEEQVQFNRKWYAKVWNMISADAGECRGERCPAADGCFLLAARRSALASNIVVINHSLFFSEVSSETSFLGQMGPIIFDEAHHIENAGHQSLRTEIDSNRTNAFLEQCAELSKNVERHADRLDQGPDAELKKALKHLRKNALDFLQDASGWARNHRLDGQSTKEYQIPIATNPFSSLSSLSGLNVALEEWQEGLRHLRQIIAGVNEENGGAAMMADVQSCTSRTSQYKADLAYLTAAITDDHVFWIEGDLEKGWTKLCGVPLDIGTILADLWKRNPSAAIFTSATLSIAGNMDFFRRRTGILGEENSRRSAALKFPSPFSATQTLRCALATGPLPDDDGFPRHCADLIVRLHEAFHKNMLVLFTANSMLSAVDGLLRSGGKVARADLISQGLAGSRHVMLELFKKRRGAILLGSGSFWEGIDAPGDACELVIIPRLPFSVPSHPVKIAQSKQAEAEFGESFMSFAIPEAILRFRQGAGRLIRTASDKGALIVLDQRIVTKNYGGLFARSIEGKMKSCDSAETLIGAVGEFFAGAVEPEESVKYVSIDQE